MKTVDYLKQRISSHLQGIKLASVDDADGTIETAARVVAQTVDAPEASGNEAITLYDGVFDYLAPETIFGGALVDLRPQGVSRSPQDYVYKVPVEQFDRTKCLLPNGTMVTFEYLKGVGKMRVADTSVTPRIIIDPMNATTGWTAAGSASGLAQDTTVFYQTPASLRFLLTGSSTGTLTKTLTSSLSMSTYEDVAVGFIAIRIPDGATASSLTSVSLKLGSSALAYDTVSSTEGFLGAWISGEWLLVALDFSTAVSTLTPNWSAIRYVQVSLAHTGTLTNFRVGGLWLSLPSPHEVLFQSAAIFLSGTTLSNTITGDSDQIILNDAAFTLLEYESSRLIALDEGSSFAKGAAANITGLLDGVGNKLGLYAKYAADNPSEEIRMTSSWYDNGYGYNGYGH